ncbi:MAG: hypothetical protein ACI38Z_02360 [Parafannyhessea sp.]|uniref:hypothetical protein n=1 Tax=Parafannyhessea sp. TaxID=2847324 RepID=UPI003F01BC69
MNERERLRLKQDGFFAVRGSDRLSVRFSSGGGAFSGSQMAVLGRLADEFGNGKVVISSRLSAEVVGIDPADVDQVKQIADRLGFRRYLEDVGAQPAQT